MASLLPFADRHHSFSLECLTVKPLARNSSAMCQLGVLSMKFGFCCRSFGSPFELFLRDPPVSRRRKRVSSASLKLGGTGNHLKENLANQSLKEGMLLEFKKDSDRVLLGVAYKPDGKKNWMVYDQNGVIASIKPQQVTYIVPGLENFEHTEISDFVERARKNLDSSLLEFAWVELLEAHHTVTPEQFAEMIFGSSEALESYCAHLLLSKDEIYFTMLDGKGSRTLYGPRTAVQVEELIRRKVSKEIAEQELLEFTASLRSAKEMLSYAKPPKSSWLKEEKIRNKILALEALALDTFESEEQRKFASVALNALGLAKSPSSALTLLIDIGYFPVHVNLDLMKVGIRTEHCDEVISAAENLMLESSDLDKFYRKDLTHLKVYAIDVDEADELDDALSATRLPDGRIKVWIHVADPTRYVQPGSTIDKEAMKRGTSVFLPTVTFPMFPEKLAMEGMSLKQGEICNTVTVSVILHTDGCIAEYTVDNSVIRPTYMLTYESATELLYLDLEEEPELRILSDAASLRLNWRRQQGAVDTSTLEARIKVANPDDPEPLINLYVENQSNPAMRLVSEMMLLCGEVIANYGSRNNIPLPYRGQPQSNIDLAEFLHLPEGPVRSASIVKMMRAAEIDFRKPLRHGILGLPGYVQFTSPIRRYMDLLAHYQVKAFLRGEAPPFSAGQLEGLSSMTTMQSRIAKKLYNTSLRYWVLEYLRRQPKERRYEAIILRFIKDRLAALLLPEVGLQASSWISIGKKVGDEVQVRVEDAHPRADRLSLKEVV